MGALANQSFQGTLRDCAVFPFVFSPKDFGGSLGSCVVNRSKLRAVKDKSSMRFTNPIENVPGFFGWHLVGKDAEELIVTEGEIDAMTVYQETGVPAVSVPNGARSFQDALVVSAARFKRIVLWYDDDTAGHLGCEEVVRKLGPQRCFVVRPTLDDLNAAAMGKDAKREGPPPKDANDLLLGGYDLKELLSRKRSPVLAAPEMPVFGLPQAAVAASSQASTALVDNMMSFKHLRNEVRKSFDGSEEFLNGKQFQSFPSLNGLLGGHRKGELTIVTGPTGAGKTTFLSQLSLDLCSQGVPTLWGSFEIKNVRLVQSLMQQFVFYESGAKSWREDAFREGFDLANPAQFDHMADLFERLPMHYLKFFGSTDIHRVIQAMSQAVEEQGVEHIIIDNLQYMVAGSGYSAPTAYAKSSFGLNKFETMERVLDEFRAFATNYKTHISLVIHPRKVPENEPISLDAIMGTAKATQEADNVIIIQRDLDFNKTIDVKKNRHNGNLGSFRIGFVPKGKCFSDNGLTNSVSKREEFRSENTNFFGTSPFVSTTVMSTTVSSSFKYMAFSKGEDEILLEALGEGNDITDEIADTIVREDLRHRSREDVRLRLRDLLSRKNSALIQKP